MARADDCTLSPEQLKRVRREAERALREADAYGVFPTPIDRIMSVAKVTEIRNEILNPSLIDRLRIGTEKAGAALKRALSKVMGLFHASEGLIFIDQTLHAVKQRFIRLHETAHGFLPWQRPMYAVVEDCEKSLDPDTADSFDREANTFASEVLFQLDTFARHAADMPFGLKTPIQLAKKFDASLYASIRQYVSKTDKTCVVLVLNMPELKAGVGFQATLRRCIQSPGFTRAFGSYRWPEIYSPDDRIGCMIPVGRQRFSGKRSILLSNLNGDECACVMESFTQTYQIFILIHCAEALRRRPVLVAINGVPL